MRCGARVGFGVAIAVAAAVGLGAARGPRPGTAGLGMHGARSAETDLAIAGAVAGLADGGTGFVSWEELTRMPQVSADVDDDPDLPGVTMHVTGIALAVLSKAVGAHPGADVVDAPASDGYRAYYPAEMIRAHSPILVLMIDGMRPKEWAAKTKQQDPGPYLILYKQFKPAWRVLAHTDRPQLPTNVVQLGFGQQSKVFGGIAAGVAASVKVKRGYEIARQNCLRCHAAGEVGGTKSAKTWSVLGRDARVRPEWFGRMVKDPRAVQKGSEMPGNPEYDARTLGALTAYFQTFAGDAAEQKEMAR